MTLISTNIIIAMMYALALFLLRFCKLFALAKNRCFPSSDFPLLELSKYISTLSDDKQSSMIPDMITREL